MRISAAATGFFHWTVAHSGVTWVVRETRQRSRPAVLCYHNPEPDTLRAHLRFLRSRYTLVSLREIVKWVGGETQTLPPKAVAVTLDDGWAGNASLAQLFRDEGVTPTIFVCTQVVGTARKFWWQLSAQGREVEALKTMDDDSRLRTLADLGHDELEEGTGERSALSTDELHAVVGWADVQSHTRLHPILPQCSDSRAWSEIAGSREELISMVADNVYALAYPNGDYGDREIEMVRLAGYECALTIDPGFISRRDDPYMLRRIGIQDTATTDELIVKLSGIHYAVRRAVEALGRVLCQ